MREDIANFKTRNENALSELKVEERVFDLAFMCDTMEHRNTLNVKLQVRRLQMCMMSFAQNCICGRTKCIRETVLSL